MNFLSLFSGIEAASVALEPLGWRAVAFAEIEPAPCRVLAAHFPNVPNLGDVTKITDEQIAALGPIDIVIGGSPCQDLSVAGKRAGLDGERSALFHEQVRIYRAARTLCGARWLWWENVPGAFTSHRGRDFAVVVSTLAGCTVHVPSGGWGKEGIALGPNGLVEWCVLDAQWFGLAQRRERVFAVLDTGNWASRPPVLLEPPSLRGDSPPRREAGQGVAGSVVARAARNGGAGNQDVDGGQLIAFGGNPTSGPLDVATAVRAHDGSHQDFESETFLVFDERNVTSPDNRNNPKPGDPCPTLHDPSAVAFDARQSDVLQYGDKSGPLDTDGQSIGVLIPAGTNTEMGYANAEEAGPVEALRELRDAIDPQAYAEWCLGIVAAFWPKEVLQSEVHGRRFRRSAQPERGLVNVALSRSQTGAVWTVQDLWEAGCDGCAPSGWQPCQQCARQLGTHLSQLPQSPSPAERFLQLVREAGEGVGLLRQTLSAIQEARRSIVGEGQSVQGGLQVRRLVPEECEALQGFPRGYTLIERSGKPMADGPRYKALGNSMAVPVIRWIGQQIQRAHNYVQELA